MTDKQDPLIANYEATVTTGLESIAKDEVSEKLRVTAVERQGRILFSTDRNVGDLLKLKSICNLFVVIYDVVLDQDKMPVDAESLTTMLMEVGDKCDWSTGLTKWRDSTKFPCDYEQLLIKDEELRKVQPKFRISSNRHGERHKFTSPEICSIFGHVVDAKFGWPIKMKDFDLEIMANFNENHFYVALALSAKSLDRRNVVETGWTTLRAATCYALLRMAKIQPGDILIDPMAGSGAIPVECCASWKEEWLPYTLCGELKQAVLAKCRVNLNIFDKQQLPPNDILRLDVTTLPFRDNSIDVFVSDLPFGRRHGSRRANRTLYPSLLHSMARVAQLDSARAILLTQDFRNMNIAADKNRKYWALRSHNFVKIGDLNCYIHVFHRNSTPFTHYINDISDSDQHEPREKFIKKAQPTAQAEGGSE